MLSPRACRCGAWLTLTSLVCCLSQPQPCTAAAQPLDSSALTKNCLQELMSTPRFRCYRSYDVTGVELGGALKNVLAIGELDAVWLEWRGSGSNPL